MLTGSTDASWQPDLITNEQEQVSVSNHQLLNSVKLDLYADESEVCLSFIATSRELYSTSQQTVAFAGLRCAMMPFPTSDFR